MEEVNIEELIEHSPITRLTDTYGNARLAKIKETFTEEEQHMYLASFMLYLNYKKPTDFVVNLDAMQSWLGYEKKENCIKLLERCGKLGQDYVVFRNGSIELQESLHYAADGLLPAGGKPAAYEDGSLFAGGKPLTCANGLPLDVTKQTSCVADPQLAGGVGNNGGSNKKTYMMNVRTFKKCCLSATTAKAGKVHDYYIKLEELMHEIAIEEKCAEITQQLTIKDAEIAQLKEAQVADKVQSDNEKGRLKEATQIGAFNLKPTVYVGYIEENLVKFGKSSALKNRIACHKNTFGPQFMLLNVFETIFKSRVENMIKHRLKAHVTTKIYKNKSQVELIQLSDDFTLDMLYQHISDYNNECHASITVGTQEKEIEEKDKIISNCADIQRTSELQIASLNADIAKMAKDLHTARQHATGSNEQVHILNYEITRLKAMLPANPLVDNEINTQAVIAHTQHVSETAQVQNDQKNQHAIVKKMNQQIRVANRQKAIALKKTQAPIETPTVAVETPTVAVETPTDTDASDADTDTSSASEEAEAVANTAKSTTKKPKKEVIVKVKTSGHIQQTGDYVMKNLKTGEKKILKSYEDAKRECGICPHSVEDHYMDKAIHYRDLIFFHVGQNEWKPPADYICYDVPPSANAIKCMSIHKATGKILYYNSLTEAKMYLRQLYEGESPELSVYMKSDKFRRCLETNTEKKYKCKTYPISEYEWSRPSFVGEWIPPERQV